MIVRPQPLALLASQSQVTVTLPPFRAVMWLFAENRKRLGRREDRRHLVDALFQPSLGQVPGFLPGVSVLNHSHRRATGTGC
jgi:hypothetical protein